jgi:hypothetical protein
MKTKRLLCPQRVRRVPHQFSWIDQRLVRDGHISRCGGVQALGLYLLLVTVADSQGLSYYSDKTAARLLGLNEVDLRQARHNGLRYWKLARIIKNCQNTSSSSPPPDLH